MTDRISNIIVVLNSYLRLSTTLLLGLLGVVPEDLDEAVVQEGFLRAISSGSLGRAGVRHQGRTGVVIPIDLGRINYNKLGQWIRQIILRFYRNSTLARMSEATKPTWRLTMIPNFEKWSLMLAMVLSSRGIFLSSRVLLDACWFLLAIPEAINNA